ncbi:MAG: orotidine 5'-phosphate decarboxylase / HUMPS family protein [Candidatus Micrarchaeia archaeon]
MGRIIKKYDRSIIVACDVKTFEELENLVKQTCDVEGIGGYKVGSILAVKYSLPKVVEGVRKFTDMPVLYDHQKSMTDIPDLAEDFVSTVKNAGVDALIGFPFSGPLTLEKWIEACKKFNLEVIVGGEMTHPKYKKSEGGYIDDYVLDEIYLQAAKMGVNNFIVPGNKKERVIHYRKILNFVLDLVFYVPGFVVQGGVVADVAEAAGPRWHAIVGRAIYAAQNVREAAKEMTKQILKL